MPTRLLFALLLTLSIWTADASEVVKLANSEFIYRHVGSYDYDRLLKEPVVEKQLRTLLGKEYNHFIENMSALRTPIDLIGRTLAADGRRNDLPVRENAILCVDTKNMKVHAGIFSDSAMTIFTSEANYQYLPACITQWVYLSIDRGDRADLPPRQGGGEFTFTHKVVRNAR